MLAVVTVGDAMLDEKINISKIILRFILEESQKLDCEKGLRTQEKV